MKQFKHFFIAVIWVFFAILLSLIILTRISPIQQYIGSYASSTLSKTFGTEVNIGRIDIGLFNRFIIDDVEIFDQNGHQLLCAGRISAKFDIFALAEGKISISSAQLFGMKATLSKPSANGKANYQFIIDSLKTENTTAQPSLDLSVKSLIIRNSRIKYDQQDIAHTNSFSLKHLDITNLSTHIMLNILKEDSLNLFVKKISCTEHSGLKINNISFNIIANKQEAKLNNLVISLPHSNIAIPMMSGMYHYSGGKLDMFSIRYVGELKGELNPSDLSFIMPTLHSHNKTYSIHSTFRGTNSFFRVNNFLLRTENRNLVKANGSILNWNNRPSWNAEIQELRLKEQDVSEISANISKQFKMPNVVSRLGEIYYKGKVGGSATDFSLSGILQTDVGSTSLIVAKHNNIINTKFDTKTLDIGKILDIKSLGNITASLYTEASYSNGNFYFRAVKGTASLLEYNNYSYRNITIDGHIDKDLFIGKAGLDDTNGSIILDGTVKLKGVPSTNIQAKIRNFNPTALNILKNYRDASFNMDIHANIKGHSINDALGELTISNCIIKDKMDEYILSFLSLKATKSGLNRIVSLKSDFGHININGQYNYASILQSLTNIINSKLPTFPGIPKVKNTIHNDFSFDAVIEKSDWLQHIFDIPIDLKRPFLLKGNVDDHSRKINMTLNMPKFEYAGKTYDQGYIRLDSPNDTLQAFFHLRQYGEKQIGTYWNIKAQAAHNKLYALLSFENNGKHGFAGLFNTETQFYKNKYGHDAARLRILPSEITVGDSIWSVRSATIDYYKKHLSVGKLAIEHNKQHIIISGNATSNPDDTVMVDLKDVDVSYILNLINFHSVEFSGKATGYAYLSALFGIPEAKADFWVKDFRFQDGRMGILSANASLNHHKEQIDIDATAYDGSNARTLIKGYVSPQRNYIDLNIYANNTRGEFLESFCSSFMRNTDLKVNGNVRVIGDLSKINLEGKVSADGTVDIKPLNTTYTLTNCPITLIPNEIKFDNGEIRDRNGNIGIISGSLYHKYLTRLSYDIKIDADKLLAYDFTGYGNESFYGTVYATGDCRIKGKSGEVTIETNITPEKGSFIEYNAASPDAINNQAFIHWSGRDSIRLVDDLAKQDIEEKVIDIPSDIHLNLNINCTPNATLRVLMDKQSGDYIALNGTGSIKATYFNKGNFDIFGTYEVSQGTYKLTIQNIIRRDFQFLPGSTIGFGGNAMEAQLNLKAQYAINGVSLSDLNIGKSFTSNNIKVNCLMNITGTAMAPKIDFGLDMPTISSDAKQMVTNLINSEEGMNQQVLYLLAVGRFYPQNNNRDTQNSSQQQSRTSLAMQSILSGTISQQLNNILNSVTKNGNWNIGANISTGDEGWNNAEYEGLLSGRMLNNRLIFNGQFGYRDKANATSSFIGDFDLQYLIYPNGNLAIRVYSQSNDRYFTRNSLNTQGLGLILKKDFNGWKDLLGLHKKKTARIKKKKKIKR